MSGAPYEILTGDCIEQMRAMPDCSVDAIVTDPPYGIGFMGKEWDGKAIAKAAKKDAEKRKSLGPESASRPGRKQARSSSAFGSAAIQAGPVRAGKDFQDWCERWATEALRVLKPGGHALVFGSPRTYHRLACAIEDAGFEIRDSLAWLYGQGFPKSHNVGKAIDKAAGAEREIKASGRPVKRMIPGADQSATGSWIKDNGREFVPTVTAPATPEAQQWDGWGTALKPAIEPIVLARKPIAGTVAANVIAHGTGALNIDACRIGPGESVPGGGSGSAGRWPANVILSHAEECEWRGERAVASNAHWANSTITGYGDGIGTGKAEYHGPGARPGTETVEDWDCVPGCPVRALDEQTGTLRSGANPTRRNSDKFRNSYGEFAGERECAPARGADKGGASRFFYCAKAAKKERNAGLRGEGAKNAHPTVKPIALMRYLIRLVTPPGGTVLDPFLGSGTTGCAAVQEQCVGRFVGIEREAEYVAIAEARIAHWAAEAAGVEADEQ